MYKFVVCNTNSNRHDKYFNNYNVFVYLLGALESDYPVDEEILKAESYPQYNPPPMDKDNQATDSGIGDISFVQCVNTGGKPSSKPTSPMSSPFGSPQSKGKVSDN